MKAKMLVASPDGGVNWAVPGDRIPAGWLYQDTTHGHWHRLEEPVTVVGAKGDCFLLTDHAAEMVRRSAKAKIRWQNRQRSGKGGPTTKKTAKAKAEAHPAT